IYRPNSTAMLILPTTYGVFLCSVATIKRASIDFSALLVVIARALHRLSEGDTVLKASYDIVYDAVHTKHKSTASTPRTEEFIDALFEDGNIPEIEAWKYWHRENNDLALFFEEG
ncbi:hypothetical protein J6Z37_01760, partial [Candidatus Saccharibacteria bacterium]|nr:hypothetical protein [Candidatus Saccharibacteria bacterium]